MNTYLRILSLTIFLFCLVPGSFGFQSDKSDLIELKKLLTEAVKEDFEVVKDFHQKQPDYNGREQYWLVHLKPKRSGHFALKYSFKYTHKSSHPEEGENELYIRVGTKGCHRYNNNNHGLSNLCLGDTAIVPIFIHQVTGHQFSLKSNYQDGEQIGKTQYPFRPTFTSTEPIKNPLEEHLKYLGTQRSEQPHRACCNKTVVYTAYFEAKKTGRFNLGLFNSFGDENADNTIKLNPLDGMPIIIIDPGTPITGLVYHGNTITYSDNKRFSSHSGHSFITKLLILQPGDVFAIEYATHLEREGFGKELPLVKKSDKLVESKLVMQKLPFTVNKDWSYNQWIIDYLPKEN